MYPLIEKNRGWKSLEINKVKAYYAGNINKNFLDSLIRNIGNNIDGVTVEALKSSIKKFSGSFAIIIGLNKRNYLAIVDRIRSIPIFVGKTRLGYQLGNYAPSLKDLLNLKEKNQDSVLSFKMSGYCIGRDTLYKGLTQLLPGEACLIKEKNLKYFSYYQFTNKISMYVNSKKKLSDKLSILTLTIMKDLLKKNKEKKNYCSIVWWIRLKINSFFVISSQC